MVVWSSVIHHWHYFLWPNPWLLIEVFCLWTLELKRSRVHLKKWGISKCWTWTAFYGYVKWYKYKNTMCNIYICAMVKSRYIGDGHPTFNRNPFNGYINPYYWVDDHPLLHGNNGRLDPGMYIYIQNIYIHTILTFHAYPSFVDSTNPLFPHSIRPA